MQERRFFFPLNYIAFKLQAVRIGSFIGECSFLLKQQQQQQQQQKAISLLFGLGGTITFGENNLVYLPTSLPTFSPMNQCNLWLNGIPDKKDHSKEKEHHSLVWIFQKRPLQVASTENGLERRGQAFCGEWPSSQVSISL